MYTIYRIIGLENSRFLIKQFKFVTQVTYEVKVIRVTLGLATSIWFHDATEFRVLTVSVIYVQCIYPRFI